MSHASNQASSTYMTDGLLVCTGAQVRLKLKDGTTLHGEIVRGVHLDDGAAVLTVVPWGTSRRLDVPRGQIRAAAAVEVLWTEHHRIACEQARRFRP